MSARVASVVNNQSCHDVLVRYHCLDVLKVLCDDRMLDATCLRHVVTTQIEHGHSVSTYWWPIWSPAPT